MVGVTTPAVQAGTSVIETTGAAWSMTKPTVVVVVFPAQSVAVAVSV